MALAVRGEDGFGVLAQYRERNKSYGEQQGAACKIFFVHKDRLLV